MAPPPADDQVRRSAGTEAFAVSRVALISFAVALAVRVAWIVHRHATTGAALTYPDEELHWQLARNLISDGALVSDDGRYAPRMPLYPLFLAPFFACGDALGMVLVRSAQALLGAATAALAARWAFAAAGIRAAWVAGLLAALEPYNVFLTNLLLTETLFTLIAVGFAYAMWRIIETPSPANWRVVASVALLGMAAIMTRPSSAGWILLAWLVVWWFSPGFWRGLARVALCALVLAAAMLPWGLRNDAVLGGYAWLSANGGLTLFDAQGPQADGGSDQAFLADMPQIAALGEIERDRALRDMAVKQMRDDPARVVRLFVQKVARTWNPFPNVEEHRDGAAAWVAGGFTIMIVVLAIGGFWRVWRTPRRDWRRLSLCVWLPVLYFTFVHGVYIGSVRYRAPLMPLLAVGAGLAAAQIGSKDKETGGTTAPPIGIPPGEAPGEVDA